MEETHKTEESRKISSQTSMASSPQLSDSTSGKESSKERQTPTAKEMPDYWDSEDGHTSRHKERSHHEKSRKPEPDKESSSTICKWGWSPSLGIDSAGHMPKEPCTEVPSNAPCESSRNCPRSPSICLSELEDCPSFFAPASTSSPISRGNQPHYKLASTDSRLSVTPMDSSIYGSFNFYGQPGVGRGRATPSATSLAGSQQVSSTTWQLLGLTPTHSMQTLTAEQSAKIFSLAVECQALGANLAKQFQTISSLEVIHQATTQATAYETINMGQMAHNATFSPPTGADIDAAVMEETRWWIRTKADKAWKDNHELVYNHQLHYDGQLAVFIGDAERTLQEKWGKIWECVHQPADTEGASHDACLRCVMAAQLLAS